MIRTYSRSKIPPWISIPTERLTLIYTDHARQRLEERSQGSLRILPSILYLSERNLKQVWTEQKTESDPETLKTMLVELPYTRGVLLQLIINPEGVVITLHFRNTQWQDRNVRRAERQVSATIAGATNPEPLSVPREPESPKRDKRTGKNIPSFLGRLFRRAS